MLKIGIIISLLGYFSYSVSDLIHKSVFRLSSIDTISYLLWLDIGIISAIILFIIASNKGFKKESFTVTNYKAVFIRSILSVLNTIFGLLAIANLSFYLFYVLLFIQPILASLFSIIFGLEKFKLQKFLTIMLGFFGIIISIEIWNFNGSGLSLLGIFSGLGLALSGSLSVIIIKKYLQQEKSSAITFYNGMFSMIIVLAYFGLSSKQLFIETNYLIILLNIIAGAIGGIGMILFTFSYQLAPVQTISQLQYSQIIWGVSFGYLFFSEVPTIFGILGALIIITSTFININIKSIKN